MVKVYTDSDFGGRTTIRGTLPEGTQFSYECPAIFPCDDISSIKVLPGYAVHLYDHNSLSGYLGTLNQGEYENLWSWDNTVCAAYHRPC